MVPEFPEPPFHVLVREVLGDVVHEERSDGAAVVPEVINQSIFIASEIMSTQLGNETRSSTSDKYFFDTAAQKRVCLKGQKMIIFNDQRGEKIAYADVMALYRSWPAVSQICALIVLPST